MGRLLDSIESPTDLEGLEREELDQLAGEIRRLIVEVVSKNRGHLASNLGVVELTLALHRSFDFRRDRLVWDCGHQTYTHKIITGRRDQFDTLRREGGISGFLNPRESDYDTFRFGHTATSISAALGLAEAGRADGKDRRVVAVIGDGAIASGMAFEALNDAGVRAPNLLVVLNDNRMSISSSVGAFAHYLRKLRSRPPFADIRREMQDLIPAIPVVGRPVDRVLSRLRDGIQTALTPGGLFVELGFHYYGPVDGHNIGELIDAFEDLKNVEGPVLLHVVTEKGHGFRPASRNPTRYHSSKRFELENGTVRTEETSSGLSYSSVFGAALCELAQEDADVVAITAAMPDGTGLTDFADRFSDRYYNVGICEQHGVGLATGLAAGGLKPICAIYSTFLQRAFDQLCHDIALQEAPVLFCVDRAGLVGPDGPTHHGLNDIAYCRIIPGFAVMAPADGAELRGMLRLAVEAGRPAAIRYPRENVPDADPGLEASCGGVEFGRAEVRREGADACIIAYGALVERAVEAAAILEEDGLEVGVVNARFAAPLDREALCCAVREHPVVLTAEDHCVAGGFGAAVLEMLAEEGVAAGHLRVAGVPRQFIPHGPRESQLARCRLDASGLAERVRRMVEEES